MLCQLVAGAVIDSGALYSDNELARCSGRTPPSFPHRQKFFGEKVGRKIQITQDF